MRTRARVAAAAIALGLVVAAVGSTAPAAAHDDRSVVPGSLLVTVRGDDVAAAVERTAPGASRTIAPGVLHVQVDPVEAAATASALGALTGVVAVEPEGFLWTARTPSDPYYSRQWAHTQTGIPVAWDTTTGGADVTVAVIDTGMNGLHPDLARNIVQQVDVSTGFLAGPAVTGVDNDTCGEGHGTWVGGVVAAEGDNDRDVAGVAWQASLIDVAVNSTRPGAFCGTIPFSAVIAGIEYARTQGADIINLSLGGFGSQCPTSVQAVIDAATASGSLVIASAGNGEQDPATAGQRSYPASCRDVISVAATGQTEQRAAYSTTNDAVDLTAPGGDADVGGIDGMILTTHHQLDLGSRRRVQGTSFSAPYVAGVAALLRTVRPSASPAELTAALLGTARDLGPAGRDVEHGEGLVQPAAAVAAMTGVAPAPPPAAPAPEPVVVLPDPQEETASREPPPVEPSVQRLAAGTGVTLAAEQAAAVSRELFADAAARHVVLARADDFADALAGSSLGGGVGPILFTPPDGPLPDVTADELRRVLPSGGRVYLMGGQAALSAAVADGVEALGLEAVRLAGPTREATAAVVAEEVVRRRAVLGLARPSEVLLVTRGSWPDAVTAGTIGATFGVPILLTAPDALHPATADALTQLRPDRLTVVGGSAAVGEAVQDRAADLTGAVTIRLAGPSRDATAVAVADEALRRLQQRSAAEPRFAIVANVRADGAYAHVLSATAIAGASSAVVIPVEGRGGDVLTAVAADLVRRLPADGIIALLAGDTDVIDDELGGEVEALLRAEPR